MPKKSAELRIAIALAHDHALPRGSYATQIDSIGSCHVVVQGAHGKAFNDALKKGTHVDIAVVCLSMQGFPGTPKSVRISEADGCSTIAWIAKNRPDIHVLAIGHGYGDDTVVRAMRAGAHGYLCEREAGTEVLKTALHQLHPTGCYLDGRVQGRMTHNTDGKTSYERERDAVLKGLPRSLKRFLRLQCAPGDMPRWKMAEKLGVSVRTYRDRHCERFKVKGKVDMCRFAVKWGIVKGE